MTVVLGISVSHNGSVALLNNGEILAAIQAERISRIKRQWLIPNQQLQLTKECINYCLEAAELSYGQVDAVAISTPWALQKLPDQLVYKLLGGVPRNFLGVFYVPHHFAHLEYILHFGDAMPGIVLVVDGSGSFEKDREKLDIQEKLHPKAICQISPSGKEVISAYWFDGKDNQLIYRSSPSLSQDAVYNKNSNGSLQSIGHYWRWASQYCCNSVNEAGKVMGLAAFGNPGKGKGVNLLTLTKEGFPQVDYTSLQSKYNKPNIHGKDLSNSEHYENLAAKVQSETENTLLDILQRLKRKFPSEQLYLSGGVALNVVANEKIIQSGLFKNVILNGSVEDNGTAIGAGLAIYHEKGGLRKTRKVTDFFGRLYTENDYLDAIAKTDLTFKIFQKHEIFKQCAQLINEEKILGWFQGRSEFGPRALGNRSIIANPKSKKTKYLLDHFMKKRDRYRPYAPVVVEEEAKKYFKIDGSSPVMMRNVLVLEDQLSAITHVDENARLQTVTQQENEALYNLLLEVKKEIGYPILLNTSFNLPGEPIVETPADALSCFSRGTLDYLCLGNILVSRSAQ